MISAWLSTLACHSCCARLICCFCIISTKPAVCYIPVFCRNSFIIRHSHVNEMHRVVLRASGHLHLDIELVHNSTSWRPSPVSSLLLNLAMSFPSTSTSPSSAVSIPRYIKQRGFPCPAWTHNNRELTMRKYRIFPVQLTFYCLCT